MAAFASVKGALSASSFRLLAITSFATSAHSSRIPLLPHGSEKGLQHYQPRRQLQLQSLARAAHGINRHTSAHLYILRPLKVSF
jgi:hypothetical protein